MAPTSSAIQLKEEGNALFVKKDFKNAYKKYTAAIAPDDQNAILYANRSACSFGMRKFIDASSDARKVIRKRIARLDTQVYLAMRVATFQATEFDPGYAKGWSRRACAEEALMEWQSAVESWQKAFDALPKADLSPAELQQKEQYTSSLQNAQRCLEEASSKPAPVIIVSSNEKKPWQAAVEMLPELEEMGPAGYSSSAWVIYNAYKEFQEGVDWMKSLKKIKVPGTPQGLALVGSTMGLTCISNGLMRDLRVFHMDTSDWVQKYNDQVMFEAQKFQAWTTETLDVIKMQALERQKKGWDNVRPALSVTVRAWITRAIFDKSLRNVPHVSVELLKQTLDLLEWGRQTWSNASKDDRGVIFEASFVRGTRAIYLDVLMQAYAHGPSVDKKAMLETLFKEANLLILESRTALQNPITESVDPGFASSFYVYPVGEAHAMLGFYYARMAESSPSPLAEASFLKASLEYSEAATTFPQDDEHYCFYLQSAIRNMLSANLPIHTIEASAKYLREAIPKMQRIWANSALAKQGRDVMIQQTLDAVERRRQSCQ